MIASTAFGLLVLLSMAIGGPLRGRWGSAVPLVFTVGVFNGGLYYYVVRPLRRDLAAGFAETVSGPVESRWQGKQGVGIRIAGQGIDITQANYYPEVGEQVSVDFLPRSKKALKVTKLA